MEKKGGGGKMEPNTAQTKKIHAWMDGVIINREIICEDK